jgi:SAM-dependent methyltransferase
MRIGVVSGGEGFVATDRAWHESSAVRYFLEDVRGAAPFAAEQFEIMLRLIASARRPVRRFLDLGCGDGALSAVLLGAYPAAEGVLVDFSRPMLDAAAARLTPDFAPRLILADLATPEWRDDVVTLAPFDAVVSGFAIHHLHDERKRALDAEIFDLLAPGGTFAHIEHVAPEEPWISDRFHAGMVDALHDFAARRDPRITRDVVAAEYAAWPDHDANILAPLDVQLGWLREIGFSGVVAPFRWYEIAVFGGHRPR